MEQKTYGDAEFMQDLQTVGQLKNFQQEIANLHLTLTAFSFGLVDDQEKAREIATSAIACLFKKGRDFASKENVRAFLNITVRNESLNWLKYRQRQEENARYERDIFDFLRADEG
jgi:DNA-directed RNA polymerase specialized sigma24 family protein